MNSPRRRALGITYSPKEGWEVTAATLADGDDAGGGPSHPDVAEQKDYFRHWRHAVTSVGEGRCIQLFRAGEGKNLCLRQNIIWRETMTSPLEEPRGSSPTLSLARSRAGLILARPLLRGAAVLPSWPSCCSPRVPSSPEQLVALAGCPTLEQDVSDLVCRDGSNAH